MPAVQVRLLKTSMNPLYSRFICCLAASDLRIMTISGLRDLDTTLNNL